MLLDILFEILTLFMHCYPNLSEHLHDYYFELSGESLISILLKSISGVLFVWNIVFFFFIFFVCVGFCTLDKTVTSPSLNRVVSVGDLREGDLSPQSSPSFLLLLKPSW